MKNAQARLHECMRLESKIINNLKIYHKLNFFNMYIKAHSNTEKKANRGKEEKGRCWRSFFLRSQNMKTSTYMNERESHFKLLVRILPLFMLLRHRFLKSVWWLPFSMVRLHFFLTYYGALLDKVLLLFYRLSRFSRPSRTTQNVCLRMYVEYACVWFFKVTLERGRINHSTETGMDGGPYSLFRSAKSSWVLNT